MGPFLCRMTRRVTACRVVRRQECGYAMVALLVSLSIMGIMLTVAMPVWKQMAQREKEAELIFRGQQYARAIGLFQRKAGPGTLPPNLDILVEQRFLRRKYKDPITNEDFQPLLAGQPTAPGTPAGRGGSAPAGQGQPAARSGGSPGAPGQPGTVGGIMGVVSKSKAKSIRLYNGRGSYDQWAFTFTPPAAPAGEGGAGGARPGGRGGPGGSQGGGPTGPMGPGGPGGRGNPGGPMGPGGPGGPGVGPSGPLGPGGPGGRPGGGPGSGNPFGASPFQPQPSPR